MVLDTTTIENNTAPPHVTPEAAVTGIRCGCCFLQTVVKLLIQ